MSLSSFWGQEAEEGDTVNRTTEVRLVYGGVVVVIVAAATVAVKPQDGGVDVAVLVKESIGRAVLLLRLSLLSLLSLLVAHGVVVGTIDVIVVIVVVLVFSQEVPAVLLFVVVVECEPEQGEWCW